MERDPKPFICTTSAEEISRSSHHSSSELGTSAVGSERWFLAPRSFFVVTVMEGEVAMSWHAPDCAQTSVDR
jgi:hypothetical protein